jgi:hypothetical protein
MRSKLTLRLDEAPRLDRREYRKHLEKKYR